MLNTHLAGRPNLRTAGGSGPANPWLFPGASPPDGRSAQGERGTKVPNPWLT